MKRTSPAADAIADGAANAAPQSDTAALADALKFLGHDAREGHSSTLALLELQRIKPDPMTLEQLMERVEQNARRSLAAVDDFMDLAQARRQPLRIAEVDLADLLVERVADAWTLASRQGVHVQVTPGPDSVLVDVDRELFDAAVAKLLRGAIARAPKGAEIVCGLRLEGVSRCVLEVTEPAPAVDSVVPPRRARRSSAGQLLAQAVFGRHGGTVQIDSRPDGGQTLRMQMPCGNAPFGTGT